MAAASPGDIVSAVIDALSESGAQGHLVSPMRSHPRRFRVTYRDGALSLWVYIWTLTHGGATRSAEEYRIQMTTVAPPLSMNPEGPTLLLGWNPEHQVFGGFDILKHRDGFKKGSNSVQISLTALLNAENFSWGFYTNQYKEVAVAFRPAEMINYALNSRVLHADGPFAIDILNRTVRLEIVPNADLVALPERRRRIIEQISRLARASNFRDQILSAYTGRCAVSRVQLKLVDAAHILPVGAEGSTDSVCNGLCLEPTYHRAFDQGLIYLTTDLRMKLNFSKLEKLASLGLTSGLDRFRECLDQPIFLPANPEQRPSIKNIGLANAFRNIDRR